MAISYPITLPSSPSTARIRLRPRSVVAIAEAPDSLVSQVQVKSGMQWVGTFTLPPQLRATAEPWIAALTSLNGMEGSFLAGDNANLAPRGVATGTPLVKGGSQSGRVLVTDGWSAGVSGIVKAGDWFQLGSGSSARLYKVMADANSNGSGEASLEIWPALRSSPADNAALTLSSPKGKFMLAAEFEGWDINEQRIYEGFSFEIMEDLRP